MMKWDPQAEEALKAVPFVVRPLAKSRIEQTVQEQGRDVVTREDYEECYRSFRRVFGSRGDRSLKEVAPTRKADAPEMVLVETCAGEMRGCPHLLIPVSDWAERLEQALHDIGFSERLLERVKGDTVLLHHKFRVSISGCPNCCSQPQIKEFGVHGQWEPRYIDGCTDCGLCVEACPDSCIALDSGPVIDRAECLSCGDCVKACPMDDCLVAERKGARVLVGGKLGRRPRMATPVAEFASLEDTAEELVAMAQAYLAGAEDGERVAEWAARTRYSGAVSV